MGPGIALDDAAILAIALEAILYGFSLLMFICTIWVLIREGRRHTFNWMMISVAVVLLVLSTVHMIVDIIRAEEGLVKFRTTPGGPLGFFRDNARGIYVARTAIYTLQTLVGDGVVIYRCYVVWQSIRIIILPSMLWCSVAVTGVGAVYSISLVNTDPSSIYSPASTRWTTAFFTSTLTTNLLSSGLLAYKVWTIERSVAFMRTSTSTLKPVLRVLVDAALLYSAALLTALICFVSSNHGEYVVVSMVMPIISISFYMAMIRIAMQQKHNPRHFSSSLRAATAIESHYSTFPRIRPLQVHVSQFSMQDFDPPYQLGDQETERDAQRSSTHEKEESGSASSGV